MRPTTQKNNARQRKTIAIVAVIAVVAIALAAVAPAFNGVKVSFLNYFAPRCKHFRTVFGLYMADSGDRQKAYRLYVAGHSGKTAVRGCKITP